MDISVIIPSFNGLEYLSEYLPEVIKSMKSSQYKSEIIIVDDKSSDDTYNILTEKYKDEPIVKIESNPRKGACSARNHGVSVSSGKYLLFIDNDVTLEENFLEKVVPHFSDDKVGIIACAIYHMADNSQLDGIKVLRWRKGFFRFTSNIMNDDLKISENYQSYGAQGACFLCSRKAFDEAEGINEILEPYLLEETDLIYKVLKLGYIIKYEPMTKAMHKWGGTVTNKLSERTKYLRVRNRYMFVYIHMHSTAKLIEHFALLPFRFLFFSVDRKAIKEIYSMRDKIKAARTKEIARANISDEYLLSQATKYAKDIAN